MRVHLIYIKNIQSRVALLFVLILLLTIILQLLNKDISPVAYSLGVVLVVFVLSQTRVSSYYYTDKSSSSPLNQIQVSFLPLLFYLPIKRSAIVIRDFTSELITTTIYTAGLSIPYFIFKFFSEEKFFAFEIIKMFLFATSLTVSLISLYSTALALLSSISIKNIFSVMTVVVNICFFFMIYTMLVLISKQNPNLAQIISVLYNDSKNLLLMFFISTALYLTAIWVNIKMVYRWEV